MPTIDIDKLPDAVEFALVPEGEYLLEVVESLPGNTINSDEMYTLKLKIQDGEYVNQNVIDRVVFASTGKAASRLKHVLKNFGFSGKASITPDSFLGVRVYGKVKHREYEGKTYANIDFMGYRSIEKSMDETTGGEDLPF